MTNNHHKLIRSGMQFFGQMSASATHEIKNTLAIINESAGLLEDLTMMAERKPPLSLTRVNDISQRVKKQVERTDLVVRKLNRFSHSVDREIQIIDLEETTCFVLNLASRLIEMQETTITVSSPASPITVTTDLFYLENIIWRAIESLCCQTKGEKQIMISFGADLTTPSIWFSIDTVRADLIDNLFESKEDQALMEHLDISIEKNKITNGFGLLWPERI